MRAGRGPIYGWFEVFIAGWFSLFILRMVWDLFGPSLRCLFRAGFKWVWGRFKVSSRLVQGLLRIDLRSM